MKTEIRLDTFTNGVGEWWLTATNVLTGRFLKAQGKGIVARREAEAELSKRLVAE